MESEFLLNLKDISLEVIIISVLVFALTMLIKWPIKKATAKLEENKRKAVNTVIVFIPMLLSFIFSVLYYGFFEKEWFSTMAFETMGSSYVLAVAVYAIYSRIVILIKGAKKSDSNTNEDLSKETIAYIKQNIKAISKTLKVDEKNLTKIVTEIDKLLSIRNELTSNMVFQDIAQTEKLDNQLSELEKQKAELTNSIAEMQKQIENYQTTINKRE